MRAADSANESESARIAAVTRPTADFSSPEKYESRPAGAATVFKQINRDSFSHPSANMAFERELDFKVGNGIFKKIWVSAPSSTKSSDGLGPLFNARACQRCHLKDGRGRPPAPGEPAVSMFLRLSIPPQNESQQEALDTNRRKTIPDPTYGGQLQNFSIQGIDAEGEMGISYSERDVTLADGTVVTLREPAYELRSPAYGPPHPELMISARVAPPMIGMGLLEAISESDILSHADPEDSDGDGIFGKPNRVWSDERNEVVLGRFGWKAGEPTVSQQAAGAFRGDIGISSPLFPDHVGDCTPAQQRCIEAPHGNDHQATEATSEMFDVLVFYSRNLGVPARRDVDDPQALEGKRLFYESGCTSCHVPKYVTRRDAQHPEQSFQLIWPYTDLLLHDMGEGLADHRPEGNATGREWRTPPLWGIGLTETVSGHTYYLHDGRARGLLEAILWHGGEAEPAKQRVVDMSRAEREALLAFLNSL
ncbi:MAG: di-heme oxidoredictase family protein [Gammaproteobacteria bacterium]|nr:di-heme oxidoredictase family protein [Gammaproteobacteria bacterium]